MADLLDIAPATAVEAVRISGGQRLMVRGLSGNAIAAIVARFPELVALLGGTDANFAARLLAQFGAAIGPIIAAGCGHLADDKAEAIASALLPEDQIKLVSAIYRLTFPNGINPVMEAMTGLVNGAADAPKPVKVRLRKSPLPSPLSSEAVSHPNLQ
jgi:hypothetical protein